MTATIKAIQTRFKGHHFRSRLEARWAVFLDAQGVPWRYEHEGFQLQSGWYLPDYEVPGFKNRVYVEICGTPVTFHKARKLIEMAGRLGPLDFIVVLGDIPEPRPDEPGDWAWLALCNDPVYLAALITLNAIGRPGQSGDGFCRGESTRWMNRAAVSANLAAWNQPTWHQFPDRERHQYQDARRLEYARTTQISYAAARSARFEHGESGAT